MQPSGIDAPLFVQFFKEECPKVASYIPLWQQHSADLKERARSCGRSEDFGQFARLIDEYVEVLRAFSQGHPLPASLGAATLKILELLLCKIFMEVSGGIQTMPTGPQARARPGGKLDRAKLGKQMHELLTRGKVPPPTVTLLVSLRRQCKAAMYEPDAVQMMQQGGSAAKQAVELVASAMQSLWKHMQYTLYNQRPEEVLGGASGAHAPSPYTPSAAGYSPSPPTPVSPYAPASSPSPSSYPPAPAQASAYAPAYAPPPVSTPSYPPAPAVYSAPAPVSPRPADYQGPPLGVGAPQPVQALPNPYANMPEKQPAAPRPKPHGRPTVPLPSDAAPPVAARPAEYSAPPPASPYPPSYYPPTQPAPYDPYAYGALPPADPQQAYAPPPVPQRPGRR